MNGKPALTTPIEWLRWCVVQWHNDLATGRVKLR